jgi:hypothetical protein
MQFITFNFYILKNTLKKLDITFYFQLRICLVSGIAYLLFL